MKLINKITGETVAEIMTNHSMSIDEVLELMRYRVAEDGQIVDEDTGEEIPACYDDLDMIW